MEQHKLVIDTANIHTSTRASTRSLTYDKCTKACMYEKLKTHTNPSSGLDGPTQTCYNTANIHTSARASTRSLMYDECMKACMYEKLKTHTNPSPGLDGTTQACYWYSKHTHICSCKHTLAHVWQVHEGLHVWKIENTHKSIIRARWNNTNLLLIQQTYTHLLVQADARSHTHVWRVHEGMHVWKIKKTQIHHQG